MLSAKLILTLAAVFRGIASGQEFSQSQLLDEHYFCNVGSSSGSGVSSETSGPSQQAESEGRILVLGPNLESFVAYELLSNVTGKGLTGKSKENIKLH